MNEYTRREEVNATLVVTGALVLFMGTAIFLLTSAPRPKVPNPAAVEAAKQLDAQVVEMTNCQKRAQDLHTNASLFRDQAPTAGVVQYPRPGMPQPPLREDPVLAWQLAGPAYDAAVQFARCRDLVIPLSQPLPGSQQAWEALDRIAKTPPPDPANPPAKLETARKLFLDFVYSMQPVVEQTDAAKRALEAEAARARDRAAIADTPAPETGYFPLEGAVLTGVVLSIMALFVHYMSVRAVSVKRRATAQSVRRSGNAGIHAAGLLRIAAQPNGGEPGLVLGAALGGLTMALVRPADRDMFVVGVMAGLLLGLSMQYGVRAAIGMRRWRSRAAELADIEKPQIPLVLVLEGVNQGLEGPFMAFFEGLPAEEAGKTVEKLAAQSEERILARADGSKPTALPAGRHGDATGVTDRNPR